ncbi:unnamed protein product [Brassica rapa subsp. trilocularis]
MKGYYYWAHILLGPYHLKAQAQLKDLNPTKAEESESDDGFRFRESSSLSRYF